MYFEIFGFVLTTKKELDQREQEISTTFTTTVQRVLQEQKNLLEEQHDAELDRLERVTDSHHDTLKKALNYMMTALGGVPMKDEGEDTDGVDYTECTEEEAKTLLDSIGTHGGLGTVGNSVAHGVEYEYRNSIYVPTPAPESVPYKHRKDKQGRVVDLDLSRNASKLIPDLEAELKRLRDAQKSTHETDPTNDTHIQAQDQYDLDGAGINDVLGIWGSAIASVQDSKTNPGIQPE